MWDSFALGSVLCILFVFAPGFFLFRGIGLSTPRSLAASPLFSAALYPLFGIFFDRVGVPASGDLFFAIALGVGFVFFALGAVVRYLKRGRIPATTEESFCKESRREYFLLILYFGAGCLATLIVFVVNLDGADSFVQEIDNDYHLSTIRTFIETGNWSGLTSSYYSASDPSSLNPAPSFGFYPASWHSIVAMVAECGKISVPVALNAVNATFCAFVFPSGMYLLMRLLFEKEAGPRAMGAFVAFAFAAFPWKLLAWGPIYPNNAALCLTPVLISSFIGVFDSGVCIGDRFRWGCCFLVGLIAVVLTQANVVFTSVVFLTPYCVSQLYRLGSKHLSKPLSILFAVLFCVMVAAIWALMFNLPLLQDLVTFDAWLAFAGKAQAIMNVFMLSFRETPAQLVLGACVIVGAIMVAKRRDRAWLVVSYVLICMMYVICASTDGFLKQLLTGFWYADPIRMAANAALFAMPLASVGSASIVSSLGKRLSVNVSFDNAKQLVGNSGIVAVAALMLLGLYFPNFSIPGKFDVETGIGYSRAIIESAYNASSPNILNSEEREFVEKVCETIPEGSLVINEPNDGSAFGYGLYGLNVYYRAMNQYGGENETEESRLIRLRMDQILSDEGVQDAVRAIGAEYVLQLDQGDFDRSNRYLSFAYFPEQWLGVDAINDDTPGFEVILAEGDMRLYKIAALG